MFKVWRASEDFRTSLPQKRFISVPVMQKLTLYVCVGAVIILTKLVHNRYKMLRKTLLAAGQSKQRHQTKQSIRSRRNIDLQFSAKL